MFMLKLLGREGRKELTKLAGASTIGIEMGLAVAVGYFGGHWLDGQLGTAPYLTYFGLFVGFAAGFKGLYRIAKRYQEQEMTSREKTSDA